MADRCAEGGREWRVRVDAPNIQLLGNALLRHHSTTAHPEEPPPEKAETSLRMYMLGGKE